MASRTGQRRRGRGSDVENWLKTHTLQDIEDLVAEFSAKGEEVTDVSHVVHELEEMVEEERDWEQQNAVKEKGGAESQA